LRCVSADRLRSCASIFVVRLVRRLDSAGVLYSGSLVCRLLFPAWPLGLIAALPAGTAGLYTILGGLRSAIYAEAVQAVVLMLGALMISIGTFSRAGGWHAVMNGVDPAALSLMRPIGDRGVPWPGLLLGIPLLGFYYWCTNQTIVQRMLSAKNLDHARWGALFAGLLKLPVLFLIVLPGTCALLLFPNLPRPDLVYPNLILHLLPAGLVGLVGLVVAGIIAATMVPIASMLKPHLTDSQVVRVGRASTARLAGGGHRLGSAAATSSLAVAISAGGAGTIQCPRWSLCSSPECSGAGPMRTAPQRPCC
jgi:solute:Na+ symporter, SSS family